MSKKKKKKKEVSILKEVDTVLTDTYADISKEIQELQLEIYKAEEKAKRKAKKKLKKNPQFFDSDKIRLDARKEVLNKMQSSNLLERLDTMYSDIRPVIVVISRLVAAFIVLLLSFEPIKAYIGVDKLTLLNKIYKAAMSFNI